MANFRSEFLAQAEKIFAASHRADLQWPLGRLSEALNKSREDPWKTTTELRRTQWAPYNAKPIR